MTHKKKIFTLILFFSGLITGIFVNLIFQHFQNRHDTSRNILVKKIVKIEDKIWTSADLPNDLLIEYTNIENNIYSAQKRFADHLALKIILAKEQ